MSKIPMPGPHFWRFEYNWDGGPSIRIFKVIQWFWYGRAESPWNQSLLTNNQQWLRTLLGLWPHFLPPDDNSDNVVPTPSALRASEEARLRGLQAPPSLPKEHPAVPGVTSWARSLQVLGRGLAGTYSKVGRQKAREGGRCCRGD